MVGFRVFDVGLLIVWLIWFFRLRDDGDDRAATTAGAARARPPNPGKAARAARLRLPLGRWLARPRARPLPRRSRAPRPQARGRAPLRRPLPSRVRRPRSPLPTHRT